MLNLIESEPASSATIAQVRQLLARQQAATLSEGAPDAALRIDRIDRMIALLRENQQRLCEAMSADFSWRSHDHSMMTDILLPLRALHYARNHVRRWMRPERRATALGQGWLGARAAIHSLPLGSIGVMVPWNFPVAIALAPMAEAFAAGNRAIICMSEHTPATAALLIELLAQRFDATEVAAFLGNAEIGAAFAGMPFDHIVFTGSARVGKLVMRAAAEHLTPLTLELGGKSPTIIGRGADLGDAARRIWGGKNISSGQACIAPDYVLVHEDDREHLIVALVLEFGKMYPSLLHNPDYTAMATPLQWRRMQAMLADARERGVRIVDINPAQEVFDGSATRKLAPALLIDPPDAALVMQEEVFGPLLPIRSYRHINEALAYVNAGPRPLALYYFGGKDEATEVLARTRSGGACVNEVMQHIFQNDLPFGGCGNSGFGRYLGGAGFKAFSLQRAVFSPPWFDVMGLLRPPYGATFRRVMSILLGARR